MCWEEVLVLLLYSINGYTHVAGASESPGCANFRQVDFPVDKIVRRTLQVNDPRFDRPVQREYLIRIPGGESSSSPKKLLIYFHGFQGNASDVSWKYEYNMMGRVNNMITVFPEGMSDLTLEGQRQRGYQSWNAQGSSTSNQSGCSGMLDGNCYDSCTELGVRCGPCAFATCHNDTLFVTTLVDFLLDALCVSTDHVFATGLSNGGLMTYELITHAPDRFRAFVVIYGLPMKGSLDFSNPGIAGRPLLHINGRSDRWMPHDGIPNLHGMVMESVETTVTEYAKVQRCDINSPRPSWPTPYDTVRNLSCSQFPDCELAAVVLCLYDGEHLYPPMVEELTWLFFRQQISAALPSYGTTVYTILILAASHM